MQDQVPFSDAFPTECCLFPAVLEMDASKSWPVNPGGNQGQKNKDFPGGPFEAPPLGEAPDFDAAGRPSTALSGEKNLETSASLGHQHESSKARGDMATKRQCTLGKLSPWVQRMPSPLVKLAELRQI
jgi:hypothetical protein